MFESCITKRASDPIAVISFWAIRFCEGNMAAAALISLFEYGHNGRLSYVNQKASKMALTKSSYTKEEATIDLLQHYTQQDLEKGILELYGKNSIIEAKKLLIEKGVLTEHENPFKKSELDKSIHYLFHPEIANEWIENNRLELDEAVKEYRFFGSKKAKALSENKQSLFENKHRSNDEKSEVTLFENKHSLSENKQPSFKNKQPLRPSFLDNLKKEEKEEEKQIFSEKSFEKKSENQNELADWQIKDKQRREQEGKQYQAEQMLKKTDESLKDADSLTIQAIKTADYPTTSEGKKAFVRWINYLKENGKRLTIDSYTIWVKDLKAKFEGKENELAEQVEFAIKKNYTDVYPRPEKTYEPKKYVKQENKNNDIPKSVLSLKGAPVRKEEVEKPKTDENIHRKVVHDLSNLFKKPSV